VRDALVEERARAERSKVFAEGRLREYQEAGPVLARLAAEYAEVSSQLKERHWALEQVRQDRG
jgi:putative heme iron utilization protein